jgi:transposase InsO family protein
MQSSGMLVRCNSTLPLEDEISGEAHFTSHRQMEAESFEYIEVFYNRKRQHSTLKYKSPAQYLDEWMNAQNTQKQVA